MTTIYPTHCTVTQNSSPFHVDLHKNGIQLDVMRMFDAVQGISGSPCVEIQFIVQLNQHGALSPEETCVYVCMGVRASTDYPDSSDY